MKLKTVLAAALAAAAALPGIAQAAVLDFEGATSFSSILDFYNGGTDGAGASGTNYGVSFGGPALALSNDALGTYFSNAPSPGTIMFTSPDAPTYMNVAAGFDAYFSFYYSSSGALLDAIKVYSGLDGTGTLLGTISLEANAQSGCADTAFCHFDLASTTFAGVAHSVDFSALAGSVGNDNVTLSPVPEPEGLALMLGGLGLVGVIAGRRQRR